MDLDIGISMDLDIAPWVYHVRNDTGRARQDLILALAPVGLLVGPLRHIPSRFLIPPMTDSCLRKRRMVQ